MIKKIAIRYQRDIFNHIRHEIIWHAANRLYICFVCNLSGSDTDSSNWKASRSSDDKTDIRIHRFTSVTFVTRYAIYHRHAISLIISRISNGRWFAP